MSRSLEILLTVVLLAIIAASFYFAVSRWLPEPSYIVNTPRW